MQNQNQNKIIKHSNLDISQSLWHKMIPQEYVIKNSVFHLSAQQSTKLIQYQSSQQIKQILSHEQIQAINNIIYSSPNKAVYAKVNGRTPKDLPYISRQIHKASDFIQILHSSQYILENVHRNQRAEIIMRQFIPQISHNNNTYEIFVRGGFIVAIGQKYCDHIEQPPNEEQVKQLINMVQTIMPAITIVSGQGSELNAFLVSAYCKGKVVKITSIQKYPPYQPANHHIFNEQQLQLYYKQIQQHNLHKSMQEKYEQNEGVEPLIKTITHQADIKHYDMGEYLVGNQIGNQEKLKEWKQFIKEANQQIGKSEH